MQRKTRQRELVYDFLSNYDRFVSAQDIHDALRNRGSKIGLATVYRTCQNLVAAKEIDSIRSTEGEVLYRKCENATHHHHLICKSCNKNVEIAGDAFENWVNSVATENGFVEIEHEAELFGICSDCASNL